MVRNKDFPDYYNESCLQYTKNFGREEQPYLYNGKEFIEAHGLNTYDFGFRGYYSPIGRFTSVDPLAEQTPWQSPYAYADNRFVNAIDWMGLGGMTGYSNSGDACQWVAVDGDGNVKGWGSDEDDWHVYEVDDEWDGTFKGLVGHSIIIGWEIFGMGGEHPHYKIGEPTYYIGAFTTSRYEKGETCIIPSIALVYGNQIVDQVVNTNLEAVWHYYFGDGEPVINGSLASWNFMQSSEYRTILSNIAKGINNGVGTINMEWRGPQYHIGHTTYSYQVSGNLAVIGFALFDGFWDPRAVSETIYKWITGVNLSDGKGPALEAGGTPYDYAPSVIIIRLY